MAGSKITSGVTPDNSGDKEFAIGGDSSIDDRFFKGDLDEIKVWNRALSTEEISNGFRNNALTTNGQIFHEPYSDSDSDTPPSTESPGTETPPSTESPGTQTPPPTESPGTQTPPPTESPGTQTPPPTGSPGTQTPPPTGSPGTQTPPPTGSPGTQTPPPTDSPGTQTPPPTGSPGTQTPLSSDTMTGFLLLNTNVINDNNGTKQASNFTINILGTQASPSSFKAAQSPLAQIVEIGQGQYSVQVEGIEGYDTHFKNQCAGFTILNNITVCTITLNDLTTTPPPQCPPGQHPVASPHLNQTTQQCIPDPQPINNATGFLLLNTNVINDNNGTKQASDFTINILGTQASPSSFKAAQSPLAQIVEIGQGQYSVQVEGIEGYDTHFKNQCAGFTILNNITICTITLNDLTTTPPPQCPPGQHPAASPHLNQTTQQCIPDPQPINNATGFLLLNTNVINDNNGTKQASDFTINILGTQASPSSFKAAQSPLAQIVEIGQGQYSVQVEGIEGYDTHFKNQCAGFTILNNITVCTITLNDLTTTPPPQCPPGQHPVASPHLNQTTQQCVPDPQPINNATGFLILRTNVINDNNGTKQASDFTINILGTQASPSSLKAAQSPLAQIVELGQGQYSIQVEGIEGYDTHFKNQCAGFTILNNITICTITLNDLTTTPPPQCPPGQHPAASPHLNQTTQQCVPDPQPI